jgi:hypothetical protein
VAGGLTAPFGDRLTCQVGSISGDRVRALERRYVLIALTANPDTQAFETLVWSGGFAAAIRLDLVDFSNLDPNEGGVLAIDLADRRGWIATAPRIPRAIHDGGATRSTTQHCADRHVREASLPLGSSGSGFLEIATPAAEMADVGSARP